MQKKKWNFFFFWTKKINKKTFNKIEIIKRLFTTQKGVVFLSQKNRQYFCSYRHHIRWWKKKKKFFSQIFLKKIKKILKSYNFLCLTFLEYGEPISEIFKEKKKKIAKKKCVQNEKKLDFFFFFLKKYIFIRFFEG
jgi:hypothetical protein